MNKAEYDLTHSFDFSEMCVLLGLAQLHLESVNQKGILQSVMANMVDKRFNPMQVRGSVINAFEDIVELGAPGDISNSNITGEEWAAIQILKGKKEIIIRNADKGRCVVFLNTSDYKDEALSPVNDPTTYCILKNHPAATFQKLLMGLVQQAEYMAGSVKR